MVIQKIRNKLELLLNLRMLSKNKNMTILTIILLENYSFMLVEILEIPTTIMVRLLMLQWLLAKVHLKMISTLVRMTNQILSILLLVSQIKKKIRMIKIKILKMMVKK